jgi:hypothetical protein
MDLSPGTRTVPVKGPEGAKVAGVGWDDAWLMNGAAFDSAAAFWQGARGFEPATALLDSKGPKNDVFSELTEI